MKTDAKNLKLLANKIICHNQEAHPSGKQGNTLVERVLTESTLELVGWWTVFGGVKRGFRTQQCSDLGG